MYLRARPVSDETSTLPPVTKLFNLGCGPAIKSKALALANPTAVWISQTLPNYDK